MVCLHGGRCSHVGNQSKCICSEGYHGKHCELKLTGVNHLLVLMVLHVLIMVTWCTVSVQSGLSGGTVKKVGRISYGAFP